VDLDRRRGLTVHWPDGSRSFYPVAYLRRMSPSAEARALREELRRNPLTVLPSRGAAGDLRVLEAELIGNYALRLHFSDGHHTGIYSWEYLREIDPGETDAGAAAAPEGPS
jgi:DUF971 family protein